MELDNAPVEDADLLAERLRRFAARLSSLPMIECQKCNARGTWGNTRLCNECAEESKAKEEAQQPKATILHRMGVPERYCGEYDWLAESWPRCWPSGLSAEKWVERWADGDGPWSLVFTGVAGSGKSTRAAAILEALYRQGTRARDERAMCWVNEPQLADEERRAGFGARPLNVAAVESRIMVLDDFGSSGDWLMMARVLGQRYGNNMPTIMTTHRMLSADKAKQNGVDVAESVERLAPELFSRITDGWISSWLKEDHRGKVGPV